jgi:hypothetical protein
MNEVSGGVIAGEREAEGACAVHEPQGSLRAPRVLREAGKDPGPGDLDRVVRTGSGRVEAADRARERRRVVERPFAAAASRVSDFRGRPRGDAEVALREVADELEGVRG